MHHIQNHFYQPIVRHAPLSEPQYEQTYDIYPSFQQGLNRTRHQSQNQNSTITNQNSKISCTFEEWHAPHSEPLLPAHHHAPLSEPQYEPTYDIYPPFQQGLSRQSKSKPNIKDIKVKIKTQQSPMTDKKFTHDEIEPQKCTMMMIKKRSKK